MHRNYLTGLLVIAFLMISATCAVATEKKEFTRDELKRGFDIVAQNFGALQFAYYTFTMEFERPPDDIHELKESGHLCVKLINPYSDNEDVHLGAINEKPRAAGLYYSKSDDTSGEFAAYFINPNKPDKIRSLNSVVVIFTHEALHEMVFGDDASREEQLTRIYLLQLNDAIDSFEQRYGEIPESLEIMAEKGDVNVNYINPFTKKPVKNTDKLSPGDYMYRKFTKGDDAVNSENGSDSGAGSGFLYDRFGTVLKRFEDKDDSEKKFSNDDEYYEVIGWGKDEPIYYYSNDSSREFYGWNDNSVDDDES
ncbi:hypothetical protein J7L05_11050 [bacterium]|nr:hypothetical protein [bacterium]